MQKEYLSLGNKDVFNGQYMLAAFHVEAYGNETLESAATEIAAESSTGSNLRVASATNFSESMDALVYKVDHKNNLAFIAYPWRIFDSGGNIQNIMTFITGNVFGMGNLKVCKLLDVHFPSQMMVHYDGPSTTLDDLRSYLQVYDRPVLGTIIKPKIGLTSTEYAELCYDFWTGGGDFVKNDEPQADQDFSPYFKMVDSIRMAMDKAEQETGHTKVHSFNISGADFETMLRRADYIQQVMKPGSYAYLVDGITSGWTAIQTIRRHYPGVFLHFHRAGHGAFTRVENPIGYTVPVLTKMARLAGASGIHTGTAGVGKMSGSVAEDGLAVQQALRLSVKGDFFDQVWSEIPENDADLQKVIKEEENLWQKGPRYMAQQRRQGAGSPFSTMLKSSSWRALKPMAPISSGGLNPVLLSDFIEAVGTIDFIVTMGAGVHSHPSGTQSGVKAVLQACQAWQDDVPMETYAKDHKELAEAIQFYNKHGTQAHRVEQPKKVLKGPVTHRDNAV